MTLYAIIVDKTTGDVMQTWVGPEVKGYPESQGNMRVIPVTESKSATIKSDRIPGWYCNQLDQVTDDLIHNDKLIVQHEDTRPIFRLAYSTDSNDWQYFKPNEPLVIDNETLKLKVFTVDQSANVIEVAKDLRVNLGDKLIKLRIQGGVSQDLKIDTSGNRSLLISSNRDTRLCESHGPIVINIYADDVI